MESLAGKRLVIFGCGYVGAAVARWAQVAGLRVTALTRNAASAVLLRELDLDTVVADLAGDAWHEKVDPAPEFALNCVSSGGGGIEGYRHSYVAGMDSIVAWARACGPIGRLVYTSSTSVYPQGDGALLEETMPASGATDRGRLLADSESRLRSTAGEFGRWFILRLAGIYGPGRHQLLEQTRAGEVSGVADYHLNLIHRDDVASAVVSCLTAPVEIKNEVFNVADDGGATKGEIVTWLVGQLRLSPPRFTGEPAGGRRTVTPDRVISNAKIKAMLGWRPRYPTFRDGYASLLSR